MSKRSRKYFESFEEFGRLCHEAGICSPPPLQKQKTSAKQSVECRNDDDATIKENWKARTPPAQIIKHSILSASNSNSNSNSNSLSPSPSPPSALSAQQCAREKVFDENLFYIASIGAKNKRSGVRKHWSDLSKKRVNVFKELISKNGGTLMETMDGFATNNVNERCRLIVIVSENIKKKDFDSLFDASTQQKKDREIVFVTPAYVTSSLKCQMKLSPKQFEPKCLNIKHNKEEMEEEMKQNNNNNNNMSESHTTLPGTGTDWLHRNKHMFACQVANDGQNVNHNAAITDILDEMQDIYACLGDKWREYGYKKANGFIKKYPHTIKSEDDVKQLMKKKGFSQKLADKVLEIVNTGRLRKLNELKAMPQIKTIKLFSNIFGVGHVTAQKWYNLGLRTLDDLQSNNTQRFDIKLQQRQVIGLKYYHDLLIKIPRSEMREIEKFLKRELSELCHECIVNICGSYRRGKLKSGDIDVLVTHANSQKTTGLLSKIIHRLYDIGFLVDDLSVPSGHNRHKEDHDSYMGICKLSQPEYKYYRHIDIKVYKPEHYAFAVLYFTGSDHFNRSMRYFAKKKGFTLSDTQLAPAIRMNNTKIFTFTQKAIQCETEQQIFAALGLDYIKPTDRNTYENFGSSFGAKSITDLGTTANDNQPNIEPYTP